MKYWLCLVALIIFPASLYAYADNDVELTVVDGNEDPINSWGLHVEIYRNNAIILALEQPPNPSHVSLDDGRYTVKVYRHDMFVGFYILDVKGSEKIRIPISDLGGTLVTVKYKDLKPIKDAKVEIFSHKGTKWAEDITGSDGRTERFWLQIPNKIDEYYSAKISLSEEISYTLQKFRFAQGYNEEIIVTPWKSIVDDLVKIKLYKNISQPITGYDGIYIVELYDNSNEKIISSKINSHGETSFSNLPVGHYFLRVLQLNSFSEPTVWEIKQIFVNNDINEIKIFGLDDDPNHLADLTKNNLEIDSPEETCNCVAFRLDNVQDYYLTDVQMELIDLFVSKNAPLTVGIIGKNFGSDEKLIHFLKTTLSENPKLIEIGNHGGITDITTLNEDEQLEFIKNTNNNIANLIGKTPSVFIPPFGSYNSDTLSALEKENVNYISSVSSFDVAPYTFTDDSILRFPSTASSGYIEQGRAWYGISANQTMTDIKFSIRDYGFAVVLLHPHEYSKRNAWVFENRLDITQYFELDELIDEVRKNGLKIVSIDNIDREAQLFSKTTIPKWFKTTVLWWTEDKIPNSEFIKSLEYLVENKIVRAPQIEPGSKSLSNNVPIVFKNTAKLWVQDKIPDTDFIDNVKILLKQGVIQSR